MIELKNLLFENVTQDQMGYWIEFVRSKQRGKTVTTTILIPRKQPDWVPVLQDSYRPSADIDPASVIDQYLEALQIDFGVPLAGLTGRFFRATHGPKGPRFIRTAIGKNMLSQVGIQLASELGLQHPETYTGHCWRRSCGTSASDAGVNVTTLMALMGWTSPKTAMEYVSKSKHSCIKMSMFLTNVQRQNRPLVLSEAEFHQLSSDRSVCSVSNVQQKSKVRSSFPQKSTAHHSTSLSTPLLSSVLNLPELVDPLEDKSAVGMDGIMADSAALIREVEEEEEVMAASQALIEDLKAEETKISLVDSSVVNDSSIGNHSSSSVSVRPSSIGDSLAGMFPQLSNSGTLNINIYLGK
jgi:hypothetical protein